MQLPALLALPLACLSLSAASQCANAAHAPTPSHQSGRRGRPGAANDHLSQRLKGLIDFNKPAQQARLPSRTLSLYDSQPEPTTPGIPTANSDPVQRRPFSGDWVDPFAMTAEITKDIASGDMKPAGSETINGIPTQVYAGSCGGATEKVWLDKRDGLVIRAQGPGRRATLVTLVDITKVSFAAPAPSLFILPQLAPAKSHRPPPPNWSPMKPVTTQRTGSTESTALAPRTPAPSLSASSLPRR